MIDFERKLIFIHLPKTAGSAIESVLLNEPRLLDHDDPGRTKLLLDQYKANFCGLPHPHANLSRHQSELGNRFGEYTVFTAIRNPWSAVFSRFCYLFKHKGKDFCRPKNFEVFLSFYREMHYERLIGFDGESHIHHILNFHELESDMNRMLRGLGVSEIQLPLGNISLAPTLDYKDFYSSKAKKIVAEDSWYEIARFGWTFESKTPSALLYEDLSPWQKSRLRIASKRHKLRRKLVNGSRAVVAEVRRAASPSKRTGRRELVSATVCTHPPALSGLQLTIDSIIDQVDRIHVYLNDIQVIPAWLEHPRIHVVLSEDAAGDLKSDGGHFFSQGLSGYCFALDDDIVYPSDYVKTMIGKIEAYERAAIVCVHGSLLRYPFNSYYDGRILLNFSSRLQNDVRVDIGSNGTMAYHTDTIRFGLDDFPEANMSDIHLSLKAARKGIPIVSIQRERAWLREIPRADDSHTIYFNRSRFDAAATDLVKDNRELFDCHDLFLRS